MFFPIGDTPRPRNFTPLVTWGLIAANVAVYALFTLPLSGLAVDPRDPAVREYLYRLGELLPGRIDLRSLSLYDLFVFEWGYKPAAPSIATLFASLFLHANFAHLAGNMLFLWIYGRNVEHRLGRVGFLVGYLVSGALATLAFSLLSGASWTPLVGASGAISGVLGFYFVLFPRNQIKLFVALPPFFMDVMLIPARWVIGGYVVVDNFFPLLAGGGGSGVAYGAHLGGVFAGAFIAWAGERLSWQWPWRDPHWKLGLGSQGQGAQGGDSVVGELRAAIAAGDRARAVGSLDLLNAARAASLEPEECLVLSRWLRDAGESVTASNLLRICLASHPGHRDLSAVYLALGLIRLEQGQPTAAYQHLLSVFDFDPPPEIAQMARQALANIDYYRRGARPV